MSDYWSRFTASCSEYNDKWAANYRYKEINYNLFKGAWNFLTYVPEIIYGLYYVPTTLKNRTISMVPSSELPQIAHLISVDLRFESLDQFLDYQPNFDITYNFKPLTVKLGETYYTAERQGIDLHNSSERGAKITTDDDGKLKLTIFTEGSKFSYTLKQKTNLNP